MPDLRRRAKRRLPNMIFDFLDGGAGYGAGVLRNEQAFDDILLMPRQLVDVEKCDLSTNLFGRRWDAPFGFAPIGGANFIWPGSDEAICSAAVSANIPYALSTAGTTRLERIAELAPKHAWFQLYEVGDIRQRAQRAGYEVLLVTVDTPVAARRLRDIRNNFSFPSRRSTALHFWAHPAWAIETLRAGVPSFVNLEAYSSPARPLHWQDLKRLRSEWTGYLVVKGIMDPEDCVRARDLGCDGVVISNHGGRQLESAPATIHALPEIRAALGPDFPLIIDSGIRSGEHVVKALAAGADFVLIGRAVMYAVAAYGIAGAKQLIDLLIDEASSCLGQLGCKKLTCLRKRPSLIRRGR